MTHVNTDEESIKAEVREFILKRLLEGEDGINVTDTTPLISGGVIDSMSVLKVGLFLEKKFGVKIPPQDLAKPENMETIVAIAKLVVANLPR